MAERRRLERFDLTEPARVIVESGAGNKEHLSLTTKDVSSGGAFLYCAQPLSEGARVKLELLISLDALQKLVGEKGKAKIKVSGTIIRVETEGVAIRFENKYKITALDSDNHEIDSF
jgi:c-di-GMP-binding flagellar brake protein YcgR